MAETGKLDPFRVKPDRDMRRPYWLNEGDSMVFYLKDRLVIEDNLQAMKILIGENVYPIYETDSLATVVITSRFDSDLSWKLMMTVGECS